MKFRAKLDEMASMRQFSGISHTLSKLSKICVLRICSDRLYLMVPGDINSRRIPIWALLRRNEFFRTFTMAGDNEKNEILLEFPSDMLASSLSAVKAGGQVLSLKIKLTDKISPCITLELELTSCGSASQMCIHDIPVSFVPAAEMDEYAEPPKENFDIGLQLPNVKVLKNIVDKLKKLTSRVTLTASATGRFSVLVQTSSATIETHFKDLVVKKAKNTDRSTLASVTVDIKKMSQFLTCDAIYPSSILCYILDKRKLYFCLSHSGLELNYYLMAIED